MLPFSSRSIAYIGIIARFHVAYLQNFHNDFVAVMKIIETHRRIFFPCRDMDLYSLIVFKSNRISICNKECASIRPQKPALKPFGRDYRSFCIRCSCIAAGREMCRVTGREQDAET